jgi:hypothetical protein
MREALREDGVATLIDAAVVELLGTGPGGAATDGGAQVQLASTTDLLDALSDAERTAKGRGTRKSRRAAGAGAKPAAPRSRKSRIDR